MLNVVWVIMVMAALVCGALSGKMDAVSVASVKSAGSAVELAIGLVGIMAFWIGMMRVLEQAGGHGMVCADFVSYHALALSRGARRSPGHEHDDS